MRSVVASVVLMSSLSFAVEPLGISEDEFKMYQHYKLAMTDARVQAMKADKQLPAIAKDAGYKLKDLQAAIAKGDAAGDVKAKCEANLKEVMAANELKGRTGRLELDTSAEHAVAYVEWFNEETKNLMVEASYAAARASEACPVAASIQVWANNKASPKQRVFQAIISGGGASRIKIDKVADFADTRYVKLFEKLKSAANGDDLSAESGTPAAK